MATKKYILFMVSDNPIVLPSDTTGVQHMIHEDLDLEYGGNDSWEISKRVPDHFKKFENYPPNIISVLGKGITVSYAVLDWLKNLVTAFDYMPFRDKPKKQ